MEHRPTSFPYTSLVAKRTTKNDIISFSILFFTEIMPKKIMLSSRVAFWHAQSKRLNVVTAYCHFRSSPSCNDGIPIVIFVYIIEITSMVLWGLDLQWIHFAIECACATQAGCFSRRYTHYTFRYTHFTRFPELITGQQGRRQRGWGLQYQWRNVIPPYRKKSQAFQGQNIL